MANISDYEWYVGYRTSQILVRTLFLVLLLRIVKQFGRIKVFRWKTGVLSKNGVPLIQMVAVNDYGHWNFKPAAKMMWDYFMQFSRDPQTKELIYHGRK